MAADAPTISVVIPLYNHQQYIDATLDSALAQTVPATEIIVVDDGSTDQSWQRVNKRMATDSRIRGWTQENRGAHAALNAGIAAARGKYIAILNSDDLYHPRRFESCLKALAERSCARAVCTAINFCDGRGRQRSNSWYQQALDFYQECGDLSLALINGNFLMTTSNLFVHRDQLDQSPAFANLRYAHDLDLFLRLSTVSGHLLWLDQPLLTYRMHETNTIKESHLQVKIEWAAVVAHFMYTHGFQMDWGRQQSYAAVFDQHRLSRLLFFFFLYFRSRQGMNIAVDDYLQDETFFDYIRGLVQ